MKVKDIELYRTYEHRIRGYRSGDPVVVLEKGIHNEKYPRYSARNDSTARVDYGSPKAFARIVRVHPERTGIGALGALVGHGTRRFYPDGDDFCVAVPHFRYHEAVVVPVSQLHPYRHKTIAQQRDQEEEERRKKTRSALLKDAEEHRVGRAKRALETLGIHASTAYSRWSGNGVEIRHDHLETLVSAIERLLELEGAGPAGP